MVRQAENNSTPLNIPAGIECVQDLSGSCFLTSLALYQANVDRDIDGGFEQQEFSRIVNTLTPSQAESLSGWSVTVGSCLQGQTIAWVAQSPASKPKSICISGLLSRALFFQSAGTKLASIDSRLENWKIDKQTFDFSVKQEYLDNNRGMSQDDFDAIFGAMKSEADGVWQTFEGSLDYVVAHEIAHILLGAAVGNPVTEQSCVKEAALILTRANGSIQVASLSALLIAAEGQPGSDPWGFEVAGDSSQVLQDLGGISPAN